jgi:hypothetical protein
MKQIFFSILLAVAMNAQDGTPRALAGTWGTGKVSATAFQSADRFLRSAERELPQAGDAGAGDVSLARGAGSVWRQDVPPEQPGEWLRLQALMQARYAAEAGGETHGAHDCLRDDLGGGNAERVQIRGSVPQRKSDHRIPIGEGMSWGDCAG